MAVSFFQQVFALLNTNTGSLAYHLVLSFTLMGAFLVALYPVQPADSHHNRRVVLGLGLLIAYQMILFLAAGLAWQGFLDGVRILPFLDRAVILLSLLTVIWLWAFPERNRSSDTATLLVGLLLLTALFLSGVWFANQGGRISLQDTPLDEIATWLTIGLAAGGILLLAARRPAGWIAGVSMLAIWLAGYSLLYLLPPTEGLYHGAVRLAMMAAYPLLFLLPARNWEQSASAGHTDAAATSEVGVSASPPAQESYEEALLMHSFMSSMLDASPEQACRLVNKTIAEYIKADISLLVYPIGDSSGAIDLQCGYDRVQDLPLAGRVIDKQSAPVLVSALRQGRAVRLAAKSTSPDLVGIAQAVGLNTSGGLMFIPVFTAEGKPLCGVIVVSPYSGQNWAVEDQSRLARIARPLVHFLQLKQQVAVLQKELVETRAAARVAQGKADVALSDYQRVLMSTAWGNTDPSVEALRDELRQALDELALLKETQDLKKGAGLEITIDTPTATGIK